MKLVIITGPQAVGKMTVGQELEKLTDLKLFHNHMTIDLVDKFFDYSTSEARYLVDLFRKEIFKTVAGSDLSGLIFTYVWAFDQPSDHEFINSVKQIFEEFNAPIYTVELEADFDERIRRNILPHRLHHKPSKQNTVFSEAQLRQTAEKYRMNSQDNELGGANYLRINNNNISANEAAVYIRNHFKLCD